MAPADMHCGCACVSTPMGSDAQKRVARCSRRACAGLGTPPGPRPVPCRGEVGRALRVPQRRAGPAGPHPLHAGWSWGGRSCSASAMLLMEGAAGCRVGRGTCHWGRAGLQQRESLPGSHWSPGRRRTEGSGCGPVKHLFLRLPHEMQAREGIRGPPGGQEERRGEGLTLHLLSCVQLPEPHEKHKHCEQTDLVGKEHPCQHACHSQGAMDTHRCRSHQPQRVPGLTRDLRPGLLLRPHTHP